MNPLIRQRLHILAFVLGGVFVFGGVASMGLPVYTIARYEKVEAEYISTEFTESQGNSRLVYNIHLAIYRFTPKGGTEKPVGIHTREPAKSATIYFLHTPTSEAEFGVSRDNWRNASEVTLLLTIGIVLLVPGCLLIVAGFVIRTMNRPPSAIPVSPA